MKSVKKRYMILPILLFSIIMISPIIKSFTKNAYNIKNTNNKTTINKKYNDENKSCQMVGLENDIKGKKLSILGDSISTWDGYSNNPNIYEVISDLNAAYYPHYNINVEINDTWWMKFANTYEMELLVNNSYGGSRVFWKNTASTYYKHAGFQDVRAKTLHNNYGVNPDVIIIYLGTNDFLNNVEIGEYTSNSQSKNIIKNTDETFSYAEPESFTDAYLIMLHKIKTKYNNATIFCFTLPKIGSSEKYEEIEKYNNVIKLIAEELDISVVDLYESDITPGSTYYGDYLAANVHPNKTGMAEISKMFKNVITSNTTYFDKEGNQVTKEEYEYSCTPDKLIINNLDEDKRIIKETKVGTKIKELKEEITTNGKIAILDIDNNKLTDEDIVRTGIKVIVELKSGTHEYPVSLKGDANGDGDISLTDTTIAFRTKINKIKLNEVYFDAIDMNNDNKISLTDTTIIFRKKTNKY